ncbi:hypothetical protein F4861DRAFT_254234 [Xylaria intraflava]|nr:hypothetical protein F4861DRAFT_254234 [Xylaria intraflava]
MVMPGLVYVESRVLDPQKTSDELYNRFYNDEHLPDILASGLAKLALRYKNIDEGAAVPYIALYPVDDASAISLPTTLKDGKDLKKSYILGCDDIHDFIHFNLRAFEKLQTYEARGRENDDRDDREQQSRTICCIMMEPLGRQDSEPDGWYRNDHLDALGMCKGFRRCTRYRSTTGQYPPFLALYEYDCAPEDLGAEQLAQAWATEWGQKVLKENKVCQQHVFTLIEAQGDTRVKL